MHYGDMDQLEKSELEIVVCKHGTGIEEKTENGMWTEDSVFYSIDSIRKCCFFNPQILSEMIQNGYKFFNGIMNDLPFEELYLLKIKDIDGYGEIAIYVKKINPHNPDKTFILH